jgi:hypothetical protein
VRRRRVAAGREQMPERARQAREGPARGDLTKVTWRSDRRHRRCAILRATDRIGSEALSVCAIPRRQPFGTRYSTPSKDDAGAGTVAAPANASAASCGDHCRFEISRRLPRGRAFTRNYTHRKTRRVRRFFQVWNSAADVTKGSVLSKEERPAIGRASDLMPQLAVD